MYVFENGISENVFKASSFDESVKAEDGRLFFAKPRKYVYKGEVNEPHLEVIYTTFPNGARAKYCVNLNNGIATFMEFVNN